MKGFFIDPAVQKLLSASMKNLFNPPNLAQLQRMHEEFMKDPETQRLIQQMADEAFATEPCSTTKH